MSAVVRVAGPGGQTAVIRLSYLDDVHHGVARIAGSFDGRSIAAVMPAP